VALAHRKYSANTYWRTRLEGVQELVMEVVMEVAMAVDLVGLVACSSLGNHIPATE